MSPKKINVTTLRQQAEEKLSQKKSTAIPDTGDDTQRLVHELQVHQIELEMQNEELVQARAEAEAVHRQYTDLYDFAPVGYFTLTKDGAISKVNLAGANLLGIERSELIKRRLGLFVSAKFRLPFNAFLDRVFTSEKNEACEIELLKDGTAPLWVHLEAITDSDEREACRLVAVDISERKQAEEKICTMNAELEQRVEERTRELREAQEQLIIKEKLAVLGQLASGMGHELRNPLSVINNAVYYLNLVQPDADDKVREYHALIKQEAQRAGNIINDLVNFANITPADREHVLVSELVQRVLEHFPIPPSVKVTLEIPADLPKVFVDSYQMEQALGNLVTNAWQAMDDGGEVTVSSSQASVNKTHWVLIAIKDSGTGITPENMKRLFEPLFTTKTRGIGMGLAVSKKIVEANDGRIEVKSEPGKGSTFTVYLPESKKNM